LITGYALAMLLNVVFPHFIATVVLRRYAPGIVTALLLNFPITFLLLRRAVLEKYVELPKFVWIGPLIVACILGSIPILFALGRWKLGGIIKS